MSAAAAGQLAFHGLGKRYGASQDALRGVSFHVAAGEFCVLLGASGSGKSTLLRTVNGLTEPTTGEVRVGGRRVERSSLRCVRRQVGMIHQHFGLVERASVAENLMGGALGAIPTWRALLGLHSASLRGRACELLASVGLGPEHLTRRASALSGGQKQRVAIARALMLQPPILIADEPVASLDPMIGREVMALLRQMARSHGVTVVCSLHQLDLARAFADRIVALREGEVVFDGAPAAFSDRAASEVYGAPGRGRRALEAVLEMDA